MSAEGSWDSQSPLCSDTDRRPYPNFVNRVPASDGGRASLLVTMHSQSWGHTARTSETLRLTLCSGLRETWRLTRMRALRGTRAGSPVGATWGYACQKTVKCVDYTTEPIMVDLGGYVIILVETKDKKIKLYGKSALRSVDVTASAKGRLFRQSNTGCFFYRSSDHCRSHGTSRQMQALCEIRLPCSAWR